MHSNHVQRVDYWTNKGKAAGQIGMGLTVLKLDLTCMNYGSKLFLL